MSEPDDRAYQMRSLPQVLGRLNNGDDLDDVDKDMQHLLDRLSRHIENYGGTAKGSLTITLEFQQDHKGIDLAVTSKVTVPKRPKTKDRFFVTEDNVLTLRNPNKGTMFEGQDLGRAPRQHHS